MMIDDIATKLQSEGIGTIGTNIFKSYLPETVDTGLVVLDTGGAQPDPYLPTKEPTFQIFIRAEDYATGRQMMDDVRTALHQTKNTTLGNTYFYFILAISEGGHIGRNEVGRDEFSINFRARTR